MLPWFFCPPFCQSQAPTLAAPSPARVIKVISTCRASYDRESLAGSEGRGIVSSNFMLSHPFHNSAVQLRLHLDQLWYQHPYTSSCFSTESDCFLRHQVSSSTSGPVRQCIYS